MPAFSVFDDPEFILYSLQESVWQTQRRYDEGAEGVRLLPRMLASSASGANRRYAPRPEQLALYLILTVEVRRTKPVRPMQFLQHSVPI